MIRSKKEEGQQVVISVHDFKGRKKHKWLKRIRKSPHSYYYYYSSISLPLLALLTDHYKEGITENQDVWKRNVCNEGQFLIHLLMLNTRK